MRLEGRMELAACAVCGAFVYVRLGELKIDTRQVHADWHKRHPRLT